MNQQATKTNKKPMIFKGSTINPGRVVAQVCLFSAGRQKLIPEYTLEDDEIKNELKRFHAALAQCSEELVRVAAEVETSIGKAEAEIFTTQKHIMNDPKVVDAIALLITAERKNAEWAIARVLTEFEEKMATLDNQYLRDRSSDFGELRQRLLNLLTNERAGFLCEGQTHCRRGEHRVIVAEELTPNMIVNMKMNRVMGFVTEHGGITSHAAILARSLGVPAVSGISGFMQHVACGDTVLINGDTGEVHLHPDDATVSALIQVMPEEKEPALVVMTPSGMELVANASSLEDVNQARTFNADGIGLFRTEILFVGAERLLSEDEQFAYYHDVVEAMGEKPVTIRMLDIGGDKPLPFLRLKKEANPFLGWRGARFLLGNNDIFNGQMRALGRLSKKRKIRVLFPMVIDVGQMQALPRPGARRAFRRGTRQRQHHVRRHVRSAERVSSGPRNHEKDRLFEHRLERPYPVSFRHGPGQRNGVPGIQPGPPGAVDFPAGTERCRAGTQKTALHLRRNGGPRRHA